MATQSKVKKPIKKSTKKPGVITRTKTRTADLKTRRPHKSFQLTRRRDLPKRPSLPGYISFTNTVFRTMRTYWKHFLILLSLYVGFVALFIGFVQQEQYRAIIDSVKQVGPDIVGGQLDAVTQTVGLFGVAITGGLNTALGETQQLVISIAYLVVWLVVVWLLRQLLAGNAARVRDALYNGCAPFISTLLIALLMIAQAIPAAIGILVFSIAAGGTVVDGVVAMMFGLVALLLVLLSLYWLTSSVFALLIVTLPGTYPMAAIRAAGDIALGRRLPLMIRLVWLGFILLLIWAVVLIPVLLLDGWLNISWLPLVPITIQILSGFSVLFLTTYIYLLYRGMINEPGK